MGAIKAEPNSPCQKISDTLWGIQGMKYANDGQMTINSALFGGYASFYQRRVYSDLIVGGAYNGSRVSRLIEFSTVDRTARSNPNGGSFSTYLDAGYDWKVGGLYVRSSAQRSVHL